MQTLIFIILLFIASLTPTLSRTFEVASSTHGLIFFTAFDESELTLNPYSKDAYFLSTSLAIWLIQNTKYHYGKCSQLMNKLNACNEPLVSFSSRFTGELMFTNSEHSTSLVEYFISNGEPVNVFSSHGMTPLHDALLNNNKQHLSVLLENGANPYLKSSDNSKSWSNLNAFEYLQHLESNSQVNYSELKLLLEAHAR